MNDSCMPILQKCLNSYATQAGDIMISSNRLLDKVFSLTTNLMNPNMYCNRKRFAHLSIWTSGNVIDQVDGFANQPHVDANDIFSNEFQQVVNTLMGHLDKSDKNFQNDIEYIKKLASICNGNLHIPTVCGYDISCRNEDEDLTNYNAHFVFLGLSVSVRLCPNVYHIFSGGAVSHCTAVPYNIKNDEVLMYSNGDINVTGWGGGKTPKRQFYDSHNGPQVSRLTQDTFEQWLNSMSTNEQIRVDAMAQGLI